MVRNLESENEELNSKYVQCEFSRNVLNERNIELECKNDELISMKNDNIINTQQLNFELCELRHELNVAKSANEKNSFNKKGNSLFAEVDDRRKLVEQEYVLLKECYRSLETHYNTSQNVRKRLKSELALHIAQRGSMSANIKYIHRIQQALSQCLYENDDSTIKLKTLDAKSHIYETFMKDVKTLCDAHNTNNPNHSQAECHSLYKTYLMMFNYSKSRFNILKQEFNHISKKNIGLKHSNYTDIVLPNIELKMKI